MSRITFILSTPPRSMPGARTLYHLALGALEQGFEVGVFCRQDGVYQPLREQQPTEGQIGSASSWWAALLARGVKVIAHENCARARGLVSKAQFLDGVRFGGAMELSELLNGSDRVISL